MNLADTPQLRRHLVPCGSIGVIPRTLGDLMETKAVMAMEVSVSMLAVRDERY